jgi:Transposase DNA-binding/Transposase Tn5 dimerisation domain
MLEDEPVENWAEEEFGKADLGDKRRTARLVQLTQALGAHPDASLPEAVEDPAALKAAYRFFDNAGVERPAMLESHVQATYQRSAQVPLVLAPQDTTYLDWTHHPHTTGLGPLASEKRQGLLVHSTLAMTPERVPLGVLQQQVWAREADTYAKLKDHKQRRIAEKESQKWLTSLESVIAARQACPNTHFVSVGDREADVYDLFLVERGAGVDLLVRAIRDRRVDDEARYLWAAVAAAPLAATIQVQVPRQKERPARLAQVSVRWKKIQLRPPKSRQAEHLPLVPVWAVWAVETQAPEGVEQIAWMLLTSCRIHATEEALECLEWYACRWGIEVWHKILKSGCRIEARQLENAERLTRLLTLLSVVAWRIMYATLLARALPDAPCTILLEEGEWQALVCAVNNTARVPPQPPRLQEAIRMVARLGGFLGRKQDGDPGVTVLWKGFQRLSDLTFMYRILRSPHE